MTLPASQDGMSGEFQPRYIEYARDHGLTPDRMLARDKRDWPGGCMCGFILWTGERIQECKEQHPEFFIADPGSSKPRDLWNHVAYDVWLKARVEERIADRKRKS